MPELPGLPIGIQTFENLRFGGYLYVDKTKYLIDLIDANSAYFLSRPRRFGKSLTLSTFDALLSGKKELFRGLCAEEYFDRSGYKPCPVISLDMSGVVTDRGLRELDDSMLIQVLSNARRHSVSLSDLAMRNPSTALKELIELLGEREGRSVAILVDEYDKPILDFVNEPRKADEVRSTLRNFYIQIKSADRYVRFVFITGITKFSRMGVFSAFNNLMDISMKDEYASMLGYTHDELIENFGPFIARSAERLCVSEDELLEGVRDYYDGFSFDGRSRLYNPFSTLNFFSDSTFSDYWFETGTPSYLARYMKDRHLTVEQFRGVAASRDFASSPGEIEIATATSFLYQAGYLTLRAGTVTDYTLDYPNREVLVAMSSLLIGNILGFETKSASVANLLEGLSRCDADAVVMEFNRLLARIPYDDYSASLMGSFAIRRPEINLGEWLYRSTLFSYLCGAGVKVDAELHGHLGRADMVAEFKGHVWVMELKVAKSGGEAGKLADGALAQIEEKGYADGYDGAALLGMAIDDGRRAITEHRFMMK
jgi:hypothetical protein